MAPHCVKWLAPLPMQLPENCFSANLNRAFGVPILVIASSATILQDILFNRVLLVNGHA
jgi:hypothetical protein